MFLQMILSFSLISILSLLIPTSFEVDADEKNWMDRCDIQRMREGGLEIPEVITSQPTTGKPMTTPPTKSPWVVHKYVLERFGLKPLANKEDIINTLKEKIQLDANMRGDEIEEGDWTKDARGFIADFYDEYYADSPSSQS